MYSSQVHHIISSSDDEVTVVPLKLIRSNLMVPETPDDPNSYKELHKYSMEQCEFCDSIFHCRYDVIIHNAKHIIVPLINQTTYRCNICLHVFNSEQDLNIHKYCKHTNVAPMNGQQSFFKTGTDVKHKNDNVPKVLENLVRTEPIVKCDDSVTMLVNSSNLKNRLVFEDDNDDDVICLDNEPSSTNGDNFDTSVNNLLLDIVNNKLEQTLNGVHSRKINQNATPKLKVLLPSQVNLEKLRPSVHFKQLLKPGLYRCKRCTKTFPNRYSHILHETKHMKFNKRIDSHLCVACDRHISGSQEALNNHVKSCHPAHDLGKNWSVSICLQCKLQYHNSKRHAMLYHRAFKCVYCGKRYLTKFDLLNHQNECSKDYQAVFKTFTDNQMEKSFEKDFEENFDILKVCEVCALFFKDKQHIKYICVGENSKLQCDQICEWCSKEAYVIKLIKRVRLNVKFKPEQKAKTLSNNENRLKNIQQRLKLMNKLSRF